MGTSGSSKGPGGNVPFIPPWVEPVYPLPAPDEPNESTEDGTDVEQPSSPPRDLAPPRRFTSARRFLGAYATNGSRNDMRRGLSHYIRTGLGGARRATIRMSGTSATAGALFGALNDLRTGEASFEDIGIDSTLLEGRSASEVVGFIVEVIRPTDGSQDAEASRHSLLNAFSELLQVAPDAELNSLTVEQIDLLIENYVTEDLMYRIELDVGKAVFDKASDATVATRRLEEMKQYIRELVAANFRARRQKGQRITKDNGSRFIAGIIQDTFKVFEEFL